MKRILKSLLILSIFSISLICLASTNKKNVLAYSNASIYFKTDKADIVAGDTFDLIISAKNIYNLYGASIDFDYDTSRVTVLKISNIDGFTNALSPQIVKNDEKNGLLSFYSTFTGNKNGISSLNSDLFKITLKAKRDGRFYFNPSDNLVSNSMVIKLSDNNGNKIPFSSGNFITDITKRSTITKLSSNLTNNTTTINNDIKITALASSKYNPLQYKFWIKKDNNDWKILSDYSSQSYINWKPIEPGNYTISVYVKSNNSILDPDDCQIIKIKVLDNKLLDDLSANNSIINPNQQLNVQALSKDDNVLYKFWLRDGDNWKVVQDYSRNSNLSIKIPNIGSYQISVYAKSIYSSLECDDMKLINIDVLPNVTLNVSSSSTFINGEKIKLTANTDTNSDYEYKFWALENGDWKVIQDYSDKNTALFTPITSGNIKVSVYVKNKNSNNLVMNMNNINVLNTSLDVINSNLDKINKPNDIVNLKIKSNNPNAQFKFWVKKNNNDWEVIQNYSSNSSLSYKIPSSGKYQFSIYAKDKNSNLECDTMKLLNLSILPSVKLNLSNNFAFKNGKPITLNAETDFSGNYEYKFWALENGNWKVIQDYSSKNTTQYIPKELGETKVSVYVRNKGFDDLSMSMNSINLYNTSLDIIESNINSINSEGDILKLKVKSNNPNAQFKFWVLDNGNWKVIQDYSYNSSMNYKIPHKGKFRFSIYTKDSMSKLECDDMKILDLNVK
ncbi:hypothetical protein ELS18_11680 [Clostridium perfringens]|uniref:triple tyrosine motif-containing protein n=1 Tax=Clostridium perfringens TaxID=1502 RepID=UPI000F8F7143|nr:triple tyrosine motif-containing protein [Clostridium perfringens]RUR36753.1 hypothetical protein ELS18_11680 [Clostridium perfringens]